VPVIDFGIRITQKLAGDDALGKLQKLERQIGSGEKSLQALEARMQRMGRGDALKLDEATGKLRALEAQLAKMQSGPAVNVGAYQRLTGQIENARNAITKLMGAQGRSQGALAGQIANSRARLGELGNSFSQLGGKNKLGELEELGERLKTFQEFGAAAGPIVSAIMGIVTALTVVTGIAVGAAAALTAFAFSAADAQRTLAITITTIAGSAAAGEEAVAAIERVANSSAVAKSQIEEIGKKLAIAEVSGERFETTLRTIADASAIFGASAAHHIESIIERSKALGKFQVQDRALRGLGVSFKQLAAEFGLTEAAFKAAMKAGKITVEQGIDAINAAVSKRLGGGSAALMLSFNVQLQKARERAAALFKDVNIEPFLVGLQNILSLLDQNTIVGKALHDFFTTTFNSLATAVSTYGPAVKEFLVGFAIGLVEAYIGLLLVKHAIEDAFGKSGLKIDAVQLGIWAAQAAVYALAFSIGALAALFGVLVAVVGAVPATIYAVWSAFSALSTLAQDLGKAIVDGLINGIRNGAALFGAALKSLGEQGLAALNSVFHFGSPAKAMIQRGEWIDEGGAEGVEKHGAMARAMGAMARPNDVGGAPATVSAGSTTIQIAQVVVQGGAGAGRRFLSELADACEEAGISVGWGPTPEPAPL